MDDFHRSKQLFRGNAVFLESLQSALINYRILHLGNPEYEALFKRYEALSENKIEKNANEEFCIRFLMNKPELSPDIDDRSSLIAKLITCPEGTSLEDYKRALRYLIHGLSDMFDNFEPLYVNEHDDLWAKILKNIFNDKEQSWKIIERNIATPLYGMWDKLEIKRINQEVVENELSRLKIPDEIDFSFLSFDKREELTQKINNIKLLKSLNVFEDMNGNLTAVDDNTYLHTSFELPKGMENPIRLIKATPALTSREIIPSLDPEKAIRIILREENCSDYWNYIMQTLMDIGNIHDSKLLNFLKEAHWLPLNNGLATSPYKILDIPEINEDINKIAGLSRTFYTISDLQSDIPKHSAFTKLKSLNLFPENNVVLGHLGNILKDDGKYHIGKIENFQLDDFIEIFQGISDEVLPLYQYLVNFKKCLSIDKDKIEFHFIPPLLNNGLNAQRIENILNFLSKKHEEGKKDHREQILDLFIAYLKIAVTTVSNESFPEILVDIKLLNRQGKWKKTGKLSRYQSNISHEYLLDSALEAILADKLKTISSLANNCEKDHQKEFKYAELIKKSSEFVEKYFSVWGNLVSTDLIGAFICLLGANHDFLQLSKKFFKNSSIQQVRDSLKDSFANIHQTMGKYCCIVFKKEESENTFSIKNLLGNSFKVPLINQNDITSLFVGNFELLGREIDTNCKIFKLNIRELVISNFDSEKLKEILCETISELCLNLYGFTIKDDQFFNDLSETDQLDIWIAKRLITENAVISLHQLGIGSQHSLIRDKLKKWDDLRRRSVQAGRIKAVEKEKQNIEGEKESLINEIEKILGKNRDTQTILIKSVRKNMNAYQYGPDSVLFELFQNADDSFSELVHRMGIKPDKNSFEISFPKDNQMAVMHWGREINRCRGGKLSSDQGRDLGYDRDLEKMLILNASDKPDEGDFVTGKFGLGFKSIFLITDKPKILSGRLCFCVVGGIYPEFLPEFLNDPAPGRLKCYLGNTSGGTVFELMLNCPKSDVLDRFLQLAHILVAFSKSIKSITIDTKITKWNEPVSPVFNDFPEIVTSSLTPFSGERMERVILFRTGVGDLLFITDAKGFKKIAQNSKSPIPNIWVTTPTRECANLGFIINSDFDLDIGRSRLPGNSQNNVRKAGNIGKKIGEILVKFYEESERNWNDFCSKLDITPSDKYEFWHSFFEVITHNLKKTVNENDNAILLAKEILLKEDYGYLGFIQSKAALPNGLWGEYKTLTYLNNIRFRLKGTVNRKDIFIKISGWDSFRDRVKPAQIVSGEIISDLPFQESDLKKLIPFEELNLFKLISWELDGSFHINHDKSLNFGKVFSKELLLEMEYGNDSEKKEFAQIIELFEKLKFESLNEKWSNSSEIIISSEILMNDKDRKDELLRAKFAPDHLILNEAYHNPEILQFIMLCRQRLKAPAKEMAAWAVKSEQQKRHAVFQYLLHGELRLEFGTELSKMMENTWLKDIRINTIHSSLLYQFTPDEKKEILRILNVGIRFDDFKESSVIHRHRNPEKVLNEIYTWWIKNEKKYLSEYEQEVYPNIHNIRILNRNNYDEPDNRKNWMTLFLLGTFHTLGRTLSSQNRNFIEYCQKEGWLDIFSSSESSPDDWINILEKYIEKQDYQEDYQNWMRMFPNIYKLSKYLSDYAQTFLDIENYKKDFPWDTKLRPQTDIDAVSNAPSVLKTFGIGANFILRELVRLGIIQGNEFIYKHCFVPSRKIRDFFISLGCKNLNSDQREFGDAGVIYEFVADKLGQEKATFNNCFDIAIIQYKKHFIQG